MRRIVLLEVLRMKKPTRLPVTAARLLLKLSMVVLLMVGTAFCGTAGTVVTGTLGDVRLITSDVLELEFSNPVLNDADAQATFEILTDGKEVDWKDIHSQLLCHR